MLHMILHVVDVLIDPKESIDDFENTKLLWLCSTSGELLNFGQIEKLKLLLKFGLNVNVTNKHDNTAIHLF